jgi:hypothetical protein
VRAAWRINNNQQNKAYSRRLYLYKWMERLKKPIYEEDALKEIEDAYEKSVSNILLGLTSYVKMMRFKFILRYKKHWLQFSGQLNKGLYKNTLYYYT